MILLTGFILLGLGLAAGIYLLASVLGVWPEPSWQLWAVFPILTLAGHLVVGLGGQLGATRRASLVAGALCLTLGLFAIVALVARAAGLGNSNAGAWLLAFLATCGLGLGGVLYSLGHKIDPGA